MFNPPQPIKLYSTFVFRQLKVVFLRTSIKRKLFFCNVQPGCVSLLQRNVFCPAFRVLVCSFTTMFQITVSNSILNSMFPIKLSSSVWSTCRTQKTWKWLIFPGKPKSHPFLTSFMYSLGMNCFTLLTAWFSSLLSNSLLSIPARSTDIAIKYKEY